VWRCLRANSHRLNITERLASSDKPVLPPQVLFKRSKKQEWYPGTVTAVLPGGEGHARISFDDGDSEEGAFGAGFFRTEEASYAYKWLSVDTGRIPIKPLHGTHTPATHACIEYLCSQLVGRRRRYSYLFPHGPAGFDTEV